MCICALTQDLASSTDLFMHQLDMKSDQMDTKEHSVQPEHSAAPKDKEAHDSQAISQVYRADRSYFTGLTPCTALNLADNDGYKY